METVNLLKSLSDKVGLSGYEHPVRGFIREQLGQYTDAVRTDRMGNLIALKRGTPGEDVSSRRSIMLAAHMDEIGLMVSGLEEGFVRIASVGGIDERQLLAQPVTVHGSVDGEHALPGVVASVPPHLLPRQERNAVVPIDKLFVDVGLPAEELEKRVRIGDLVSFRQAALDLKGDLVTGKAMDNRASVAAVIHCMKLLGGMRHVWDVYAVATVQEEVGLKGAITSAFGVQPEVAIAIDVTFGGQFGASKEDTFPLGRGPTIGIGPNFHPKLYQALVDVAKREEIPYQVEPAPGASGTDAWAIQVSKEGIPTALVSIPDRYMHSPVEVVAVKDVERTGRLMAYFIGGLAAGFLERLTLHPQGRESSEVAPEEGEA